MPANRKSLGDRGEEIAALHLKECGYKILTRNYRKNFGEIDIIAREADCLVFIEVKTRRTTSHGHPFEAVNLRKQKQISKVAQCYLAEKNLFDSPARFDVVSVIISDKSREKVEILPNAFDLC